MLRKYAIIKRKTMTNDHYQFVDIDNSRLEEQRAVMREIISAGHCPFCLEHFQSYHKKPFLREGKHWFITPNQWPYDHVQHQLLVIHKEHLELLSQITPEAGAELAQLVGEVQEELQMPGGAICMRFGDTNYSAGTVRHLHAQLIVPAIDKPDFQPVRFKIGKGDKPKVHI